MKPLHRKGGKKHWQGLSVSFTTEDDGAVSLVILYNYLHKMLSIVLLSCPKSHPMRSEEIDENWKAGLSCSVHVGF
jgi:hypothetical protein